MKLKILTLLFLLILPIQNNWKKGQFIVYDYGKPTASDFTEFYYSKHGDSITSSFYVKEVDLHDSLEIYLPSKFKNNMVFKEKIYPEIAKGLKVKKTLSYFLENFNGKEYLVLAKIE